MVLLHIKKADDLQMLVEVPAASPLSEAIPHVATLWNTMLKMRKLADCCNDLATYGEAKPPAEQGIDEYQEGITGKAPPKRGPHYVQDPQGKRCGEAPEPRIADVIKRQATEALAACNMRDLAARKVVITQAMLQEAWDGLRGAVTIAYPQGLPEYDEVQAVLDDNFDPDGMTQECVPVDSAELWWAGKKMTRDKLLCDFVGRNDKTKIVAKLQKPGAGAPTREPIVDEKTQKEMMAFYYKKQEEAKKLEAESEDAYLNSAWANPKALKAALTGTGAVSWRPH